MHFLKFGTLGRSEELHMKHN